MRMDDGECSLIIDLADMVDSSRNHPIWHRILPQILEIIAEETHRCFPCRDIAMILQRTAASLERHHEYLVTGLMREVDDGILRLIAVEEAMERSLAICILAGYDGISHLLRLRGKILLACCLIKPCGCPGCCGIVLGAACIGCMLMHMRLFHADFGKALRGKAVIGLRGIQALPCKLRIRIAEE